MVVWIIGLPGSGKTTLAKEIQKQLLSQNQACAHIDGDDMRSIWGDDIGYEVKDRKKNSSRIQKLGKILEDQNLIVVVSIMSIFEEDRNFNRQLYKAYYEVFLDIGIEVLKQRRSLYEEAEKGCTKNVIGVDIAYDKPKTYDICINSVIDEKKSAQSVIKKIRELYCIHI